MSAVIIFFSLIVIVLVLHDAFETMLLPRRISRQFRFARFYFRCSWWLWSGTARAIQSIKRRNALLSQFGPLSFLLLIGLWASGLIIGFALLHWAMETPLRPLEETHGLEAHLYMSGVIFFTLGFGDVTPAYPLGRFVAVVEAGLGFTFLAVVISYLPVLYQAFSHREVTISLLDARAGSPPSAGQLLIRFSRYRKFDTFDEYLENWEAWAAEVLESQVSFPLLSFYRSQHDNQSWLSAMTVILDASALVIAGIKENDSYQAQMTFAMARHAVVDLAQIYHIPPRQPTQDRVTTDDLRQLFNALRTAGVDLRESESGLRKFAELRQMYEPFIVALAEYFLLALPPVVQLSAPVDNWQTSAWMRRTRGIGDLTPDDSMDDHIDWQAK
jgi:hypothetical protein